MSFFNTSANQATNQTPNYTGLQIQTSVGTMPIPVGWGMAKGAPNLIWCGGFQTHTTKQKQGGKGGGSATQTSSTYSESIVMALCEAPLAGIAGIGQVWADQSVTTLSALGFTLFTGVAGQLPWPYLTTNFPPTALYYEGLAYLAASNYNLGSSPQLPNHNFELKLNLYSTGQGSNAQGTGCVLGTPTVVAGVITTIPVTTPGTGYGVGGVLPLIFIQDTNGAGAGCVARPILSGGTVSSIQIVDGGQQYSFPTAQCGYTPDADMAQVVIDFLTNAQYGCFFPPTSINTQTMLSSAAATTTGDNAYQTYCRAVGLFMSPYLDSVETASDILDRWMQLTNSACFWSGTQLKIVPYGDTAFTGNGVTYVPNLTAIYDLDDQDYCPDKDKDPVIASRVDPADAYNVQSVEIYDRTAAYKANPIQARLQAEIEKYGTRINQSITAHEICDPVNVAPMVVQLILQRGVYIKNTYQFTLNWMYCLLEPMDLVTLTEASLGLYKRLVRIQKISEDSKGMLQFTCEEMPIGVASAVLYPKQPANGFIPNTNAPSGGVN